MKRCHKRQPEPPCLPDFRDRHPEAVWNDFTPTACYQSVRTVTREDQGALCAYCEMRLLATNEQIAHFHPKSDQTGAVRWAFHWPNLWLACKGGDQPWMQNPDHYLPPTEENRSCDTAKGDDVVDGQVLSPADVPAFPRLFRYERRSNGLELRPDEVLCQEANLSLALVETTIKVFNLNCRRVAEARMRVHAAVESQIKRLREKSADPAACYALLVQRHLSRSPDGSWKPFFTMIRWRFREVAETYLHSISYQG